MSTNNKPPRNWVINLWCALAIAVLSIAACFEAVSKCFDWAGEFFLKRADKIALKDIDGEFREL